MKKFNSNRICRNSMHLCDKADVSSYVLIKQWNAREESWIQNWSNQINALTWSKLLMQSSAYCHSGNSSFIHRKCFDLSIKVKPKAESIKQLNLGFDQVEFSNLLFKKNQKCLKFIHFYSFQISKFILLFFYSK